MNLVVESQPPIPIRLSRKSRRKTLPSPLPPRSRTSDRLRLRSRMDTRLTPHRLHHRLRFRTTHLTVLSGQNLSPMITTQRKRKRITAVAVASVSSCNLRSLPLHLPVHGSSSNDSPGDKDFRGLPLYLIYSDPVLHVVLSPPTFRHAPPSGGGCIISWLAPPSGPPSRVSPRPATPP